MRISAVIFDVDGLMLDTERLAFGAWTKALEERGYHLEYPDYIKLVGRSVRDGEDILKEVYGAGFPYYEVFGRRQKILEQGYLENGIPHKPGLLGLLDFLKSKKVWLAVFTSGQRAVVQNKLAIAGLIDYFEVLVTADDVKSSKPSPEGFLLAASRLGVAPENCVVLEDSEPGVRAAKAAGMLPIMVPDLKQPDAGTAALAYRIFPSLVEVQRYFENELTE